MAKASQVVIMEGEYYIIKSPNGKVLEVKDFNTENGAGIQLWSYAGHPWQQWQFVDAGEGRWRIQNRFTGKMIDLALGGVVEGTWLHQWSRTSGLSQCWALEPTRSGRTRIRNVLADKYIDLVGMNTANGAQAQIWNYVAGGNQEWTLERIDPDVAQTGKRAGRPRPSAHAKPAQAPERSGAQAEQRRQGPRRAQGINRKMLPLLCGHPQRKHFPKAAAQRFMQQPFLMKRDTVSGPARSDADKNIGQKRRTTNELRRIYGPGISHLQHHFMLSGAGERLPDAAPHQKAGRLQPRQMGGRGRQI